MIETSKRDTVKSHEAYYNHGILAWLSKAINGRANRNKYDVTVNGTLKADSFSDADGNQILTGVTGTVMFSGENNTNFSLSETVANYDFIDVQFGRDGKLATARLHNPNSKTLALFLAYSPSGSIRRIGIVNVSFSGTSVTFADGYYSDNLGGFTALNSIFSIYKIVGYKLNN